MPTAAPAGTSSSSILGRLGRPLAAAGFVALVAACSPAQHRSGSTGTTTTPAAAAAPCRAAPSPSPGGPALAGPAVASLTGGAARTPFALDSDALEVDPPHDGDRPAIAADAFQCDILAAVAPNGAPFGSLAGPGGPAIGYARVTVDLSPGSTAVTAVSSGGQWVQRAIPAPAVYRDRLAWVGVVPYLEVSGCPALVAGATTLAPDRRPTDYGYEVFIVDAATGGDGLVYTEGAPEQCGMGGRVPPSVGVALERFSVPWTLLERDPHGYSARITAQVLPCDSYPTVVDADGPIVSVVTERPFGPSCGVAASVPITLDAATVTATLPATLEHGPLGQDVTVAPSAEAPPSPSEPIVNLTPANEGATLTIGVGAVLVVGPPLVPATPGQVNPAVSSDPAVLGLLGPASTVPIAEFRAWRAGEANLAVPGTWVIHVVVR